MLFRPDDEIRVAMESWSVVEVLSSKTEKSTRHLIGVVDGFGRVCSPIQFFYQDRMEAVTRSGKIYELIGEPGTDIDADWVFENWCRMNEITTATDVTEKYWPDDR